MVEMKRTVISVALMLILTASAGRYTVPAEDVTEEYSTEEGWGRTEAETEEASGEGLHGTEAEDGGLVITDNIPSYSIIIDKETTRAEYLPEPVVIASYDEHDIPYDAAGGQLMYRWCYDEADHNMYLYYDEWGDVIKKSSVNPISLGKAAGMGRLNIYMTYPDAGNYDYYYVRTCFWLTMTNDVTGYTYSIPLDYGIGTAQISLPGGMYSNVTLTSSSNMTLPYEMYWPGAIYVTAGGFAHMDITLPADKFIKIDERTVVVDLRRYTDELKPSVIHAVEVIETTAAPEAAAVTEGNAPTAAQQAAGADNADRSAQRERATAGGLLAGPAEEADEKGSSVLPALSLLWKILSGLGILFIVLIVVISVWVWRGKTKDGEEDEDIPAPTDNEGKDDKEGGE